MLDKAFEGWNGTIFAYGQTGSGKSFSMTGTKEMQGIIPQLNEEMFQRITAQQSENPEKKWLVTCSFMEIYNEVGAMPTSARVRTACGSVVGGAGGAGRAGRALHGVITPVSPCKVLYDLLDPSVGKGSNKQKKDSNIEIKEHPALGVYVQGLQEIAVDSHIKIEQLMQQGNDMRAVAATQMNATSSRSHSIFIIKMQQMEVIGGQKKEVRATINLVDLAGEPRAAGTGLALSGPTPPPLCQQLLRRRRGTPVDCSARSPHTAGITAAARPPHHRCPTAAPPPHHRSQARSASRRLAQQATSSRRARTSTSRSRPWAT